MFIKLHGALDNKDMYFNPDNIVHIYKLMSSKVNTEITTIDSAVTSIKETAEEIMSMISYEEDRKAEEFAQHLAHAVRVGY